MSKDCTTCKYHAAVNGLDACVFENDLVARRCRCEYYERDWSFTIFVFIFWVMLFTVPIIIILQLFNYM